MDARMIPLDPLPNLIDQVYARILEAIIDTDGRVTDVRVLKPLPMGLDTSAMEAVKRWKFKPGSLNGRPVKVIFNLTVNFRLQ